MCGIAGIVKKDGSQVLKSEIKNLTDLVSHRGPDDEGFFIHNNFALGHRRLSILDLSVAGHQPLHYQNIMIIFNGEIYNYIEIRKELGKANFKFTTGTDTEVIAAAYLNWGEDCVNHFNGMWAFVIYDKGKNILFCSRDRFGVKPFYYVNNSSIFAFGSEIKQLHSLGLNKVNLKILLDFLYIGYQNHTSETFFKDIFQLEPGHNLIYDVTMRHVKIEKYYNLKFHKEIYEMDQISAEQLYESKLNDSIELRLRSDVKVGTCLSGGLDSSFIASVASRLYIQKSKAPFTSITAASNDPQNDEVDFAKSVIEKAELDGKIVTPIYNDLLSDFEKVAYHQEEPFGSPSIFMQYFVMKAARKNNCKVLLDGQGGDETLLGYERYYVSFLQNLSFFKRFKWMKMIKDKSNLSLKDVFFYYFYFNIPRVRIMRLRKRLKGIKNEYMPYLNNNLVYEYAKASKKIWTLQQLEITSTQLRSLLNYEDKNSMAWSIETRLPFLDYRVVEAALSIKPKYKINNGWSKYLLRKIGSKVLPDTIAWRKNKIGFEAPRKFWEMDENFCNLIKQSSILNQIFKDVSEIDDSAIQWKLLSIAIWERQFQMVI